MNCRMVPDPIALFKIVHLTTVHPPFDTRIFHKEAKTLVKAGYDVTLIAQHDKNEVVDGVKIIALPKPRNRFVRIFSLTWRAFRLALRQHADIYHFHDPELLPVGVLLKLFTKAKVIYDVHEDVAQDILAKDWAGRFIIKKFISFVFDKVEKFSCVFFDRIISATPYIARKFPPHKTIILRNLPVLDLIDRAYFCGINKQKPVIIYAGGLSHIRGIKHIIQAMEFIENKAELWLLGRWQSTNFMNECKGLKGWKYTRYLGYKKVMEVYACMKKVDIGIVNFLPRPHNIKSLPNKPFEYMACSLPVVMSDFPYWKEIFGGYAIFCNPQDPKDIAKRIDFLLKHPDEAQKMGKRGRKAVLKNYNWENESKKLTIMYQRLLR